ncbi:MAG: MBL fold metallo-hydrolase [Acidimicrobiales bacterium]
MKSVTTAISTRDERRKVTNCHGGSQHKGAGALRVKFYGVRGSTPCSCESNQRIGGNTACVVVTGDGFDPIVLDLGTGLRFWGTDVCAAGGSRPFRATALVSHLHWDHVQGLPFFPPLHRAESSMHIIGPPQEDRTLEEAFHQFLCPPYFPVTLEQLAGTTTFEEATGDPIELGPAIVTSRDVPHVGPTLGFRIDVGGASLAYVSDHQQPGCQSTVVADSVLELCDGVDLLIHDAQYTAPEFAERFDWGHCTTEYAIEVAAQAGVKQLALYHHDPSHDDDTVDSLCEHAAAMSALRRGPSVIAAAEGLELDLSC